MTSCGESAGRHGDARRLACKVSWLETHATNDKWRSNGVVIGSSTGLHLPIREQDQKLTQELRGHYGYYGIIGTSSASRHFGRERDGSGDVGCLGDAGTVI
jgi:hypothetical protein